MRRLPGVTLVPFTEAWLPGVQVWFTHPRVRRWLGGPEWPARALRIRGHGLGEMFRGRRVLREHSWVVLDAGGAPVGSVTATCAGEDSGPAGVAATPSPQVTEEFGQGLLQHAYDEFTFLSRFLPSLFVAEHRDTRPPRAPW